MRTQRIRGLVGIWLLALLVVFFPYMLYNLSNPILTRQVNSTSLPSTLTFTQDSPLPLVAITPIAHFTVTPLPTWTLWPSPTPSVKPTATPIPIGALPTTAKGNILYAEPNAVDPRFITWMRAATDEQGNMIAGSTRSLSELDKSFTFAQPSPNGKYILFLQPGMPGGVPYLYSTETKETWPLFRHEKLYPEYHIEKFDQIIGLPFGWHPDGQHILFWSATTVYAGLWLVNVETGERKIIKLVDSFPQGAAVSPDGQQIAYAVQEANSTRLEFAFSDGSSDKSLPDFNVGTFFGWSPDGKQMLLSAGKSTDDLTKSNLFTEGPLWIVSSDTLEVRALHLPFILTWPFKATWSPDGRYVASVGLEANRPFKCNDKNLLSSEVDSCQYEGTGIYIEVLNTGEVKRLADGIFPTWSPDGSMLAFLSNSSGNPEIWTIRTDGSDLRQFTADGLWKWSNLTWTSLERGSKWKTQNHSLGSPNQTSDKLYWEIFS